MWTYIAAVVVFIAAIAVWHYIDANYSDYKDYMDSERKHR